MQLLGLTAILPSTPERLKFMSSPSQPYSKSKRSASFFATSSTFLRALAIGRECWCRMSMPAMPGSGEGMSVFCGRTCRHPSPEGMLDCRRMEILKLRFADDAGSELPLGVGVHGIGPLDGQRDRARPGRRSRCAQGAFLRGSPWRLADRGRRRARRARERPRGPAHGDAARGRCDLRRRRRDAAGRARRRPRYRERAP